MIPRARRLGPLLAALALVLSAAPLPAADLRVLTENYPPFNEVTGDAVTGPCADMVTAILSRASLNATLEVMPWSRAYWLAASRPDTLLFSTGRHPEREPLFHWIGPLAESRVVLYARKGYFRPRITLDELKPYAVGAGRDTAGERLLHDLGFTNIDVSAMRDLVTNARKLAAGRIDIWLAGELPGLQAMQQAGLDPDRFEIVHVAGCEALYLAVSKGSRRELVQRLQAAFSTLVATGIRDRILARYGLKPPDTARSTIFRAGAAEPEAR